MGKQEFVQMDLVTRRDDIAYLYPPQTLFVGGILFSRCPSVRPSVRPSIRPSVRNALFP